MNIIDRARAFCDKASPAIEHQGGHDTAFSVAMVLMGNYAFDESTAYPLYANWNIRNRPPFSEAELRHKLRDAAAKAVGSPELGKWLDDGSESKPLYRDALHQLATIRGFSIEAMQRLGSRADGNVVVTSMLDSAGAVTGLVRRRGDNKPFRMPDGREEKSLNSKGGRQGLFMPWPLPDGPALVVEGLPDAWRALTANYPTVIGTPGSKTSYEVLKMLSVLLRGRSVVLAPDDDVDGRKWKNNVGKCLANSGCEVRFIPPIKKDLDLALQEASR